MNRLRSAKLGAKLDPRQYRELIASQLLQVLNPGDIHCVVIGDRHHLHPHRDQARNDLLVRHVLFGVVE